MIYDRTRYTVLDLLSDVGGLSGMFASIFTSFMAAWNYNQLDNFMVMNLFKLSKPKPKPKTQEIKIIDSEKGKEEHLWTDYLPNFKEYFRSRLPKKLRCCCKLSRKELAFKQGRKRLEKELNILELVKSIRLYRAAFNKIFTKGERLKLRQKSRYLLI